MKELSIEQKAKAYDEAFNRAKSWYTDAQIDFKKSLETLFPELKCDDEKIRKEIIKCVKNYGPSSANPQLFKNMLAWLEKQEGCEHIKKDWLEHIKQSWYKEGFIDGKYSGGTSKEWTINDAATLKELIDFLENGTTKLQHDLTLYANWLKIQFTPIEKQSEQKPADKVEPKFKAGDWVVTSYGKVNQVIAVDEDGDGFTLDDDTYFSGSWKDGYHLWTIKDAKDGDVLATPNYIYIFNSTDKETETVAFYCLIKKPDKHFSFGDYRIHDEILNSTPATKKQYDILIKAMTDAGYAFDFEKKELKEIEDEEYNGEDYGINGLYHAQRILEKTLGSVDGYQTDDGILSHKCAITAVKKLYKQKPTGWSEEDEEHIESILKRLDGMCKKGATFTETRFAVNQDMDWLKFLRQKHTWKPSDEQMEALGIATDIGSIPEKQYDELNKLYHDLKKLKT